MAIKIKLMTENSIHCDFISEKERNLILGGNAARILNIDITE